MGSRLRGNNGRGRGNHVGRERAVCESLLEVVHTVRSDSILAVYFCSDDVHRSY